MAASDVGFGLDGITFTEAYSAIRNWCQAHADTEEAVGLSAKSKALISAMPDPAEATDVEMRAVFGEVITGNLAWAYRKTDGEHRMAEYAHAALNGAGIAPEITDPAERAELESSPMLPHLFCTRYW